MNISNEVLHDIVGGVLLATFIYLCFRLFTDETEEMP
jgi:hypothetical protein